MKERYNEEVTRFLDNLNHPHRELIDLLRDIILKQQCLVENIKWNAPNYSYLNYDLITLKLFPLSKVQVIFHRGSKVKSQPKERLLSDDSQLLEWKANDRALATFNNKEDFLKHQEMLESIISEWITQCIIYSED